MQITQDKFNELFHKLNIAQSLASKLEWILADLGVTINKALIINGVECTQPQRKPKPPKELRKKNDQGAGLYGTRLKRIEHNLKLVHQSKRKVTNGASTTGQHPEKRIQPERADHDMDYMNRALTNGQGARP